MANELESMPYGFSISLPFNAANPGAGATADATAIAAGGGAGFVVPTGYVFHPLYIAVGSNADLTGGTLDAYVTDNGTAVVNGPTAQLADTVQYAAGVKRLHASAKVAAGHYIGAEVTTSGAYAPNTCDIDILVSGVLLPA